MKRYVPFLLVAAWVSAATCQAEDSPATNRIRLVSSPGSATGASCRSGGGGSFLGALSGDGRFVTFLSEARNLATNDMQGSCFNVYLRDLAAAKTALISVGANGRGGANENTARPDISSNGARVVYQSMAGNLTQNDDNANLDIFARNVAEDSTRLVSVNRSGGSSPSASVNPIMSADGRWVAFESANSDLTAELAGMFGTDLYARDFLSNATRLVSVALDGRGAAVAFPPGAVANELCSITRDGRWTAFLSNSRNIVKPASTGTPDVYVRDMQAGLTRLASAGVPVLLPWASNTYRCFNAVVSDQGNAVAFKVADGIVSTSWLFLYDLQAQTTTLIASNLPPVPWPTLSSDGRFLAYEDGTNVFRWDAQSQSILVASAKLDGSGPGNGISRNAVMTPDGLTLAFVSAATDLVTNATNGKFQVYARDMAAGTTRLASANMQGAASSADHELVTPSLSADGHLVAFDSLGDDLVAGDLNLASDVFVRDLTTGMTQLVSERDSARPSVSSRSYCTLGRGPCVSSNGMRVVFSALDGDLTTGDTNGWPDVFVRDLQAGTIRCAGIGTNAAGDAVMSSDGRFVAFTRRLTNSTETSFGAGDIYRLDIEAGTTELVSANLLGMPAGASCLPAISPDGRFVAFQSAARDLVALGASTNDNIFVRDMVLGTNLLVSASVKTNYGNGRSIKPMFSPDGRWLAFQSRATDLVEPCCTPVFVGDGGIFVRDMVSGQTILVSKIRSQSLAHDPVFSPNSRWVAFAGRFSGPDSIYLLDLLQPANATVVLEYYSDVAVSDLQVNADGQRLAWTWQDANSNPKRDQILLFNRQTGTQEQISQDRWSGGPGNAASARPLLTPNGQFVIYSSKASNLVETANNFVSQIYVRDRLQNVTLLVSAAVDGSAGNGLSAGPALSADGRTVVFQGLADNLAPGDFNTARDIFVLRLSAGDSDGDGMDDDWEMAYFGTLARDGTGDFDSDGSTDRHEFLAGTDPTNKGSVLRVMTLTSLTGGTTKLIWAAAPGRNYKVEYKDALSEGPWTPLPGTPTIAAGTGTQTDSTANSAPQRFYRVVLAP